MSDISTTIDISRPIDISKNAVFIPLVIGILSVTVFAVTKINVGRVGPPGTRGFVGPSGPIGPTGYQGPVGPGSIIAGPVGHQGFQGPTGPTGPQGPQGTTGLTSATGATGAQGPQGPPGNAGSQGPVATSGNTYVYAYDAVAYDGPNPGTFPTFATATIDTLSLNNVITFAANSCTVTASETGVYQLIGDIRYEANSAIYQTVGVQLSFNGSGLAGIPPAYTYLTVDPGNPTYVTLQVSGLVRLPLDGISTAVGLQYYTDDTDSPPNTTYYASLTIYKIA